MTKQNEVKMDMERLAGLRDELKLQLHLFDAETRQRWVELEKDWQLILSEAERLKPAAARAILRASLATKPLLEKFENSLLRIREGVERHHNSH